MIQRSAFRSISCGRKQKIRFLPKSDATVWDGLGNLGGYFTVTTMLTRVCFQFCLGYEGMAASIFRKVREPFVFSFGNSSDVP